MKQGVYLTSGPRDFEIIQQNEKGTADISLAGYWFTEEPYQSAQVYVRLLMQNSGMPVCGYTKCQMDGENWSVTLRGVPAGGLYKLETGLCIDENPRLDWNTSGDMRHFIGVGDVYVIAGQSNSAGYGKGVLEEEPVLGVHALGYNEQWRIATHPLCDPTGAARLPSLEGANCGTSPYLHFGKLLQKTLGYPIGLVPTALGGSPLKEWNPEQDGTLYRNMQEITGLLSGGYKGVLWYQGCSDTGPQDCDTYFDRFVSMVKHWREDAGIGAPVFLTVQLNRCRGAATAADNDGWGKVREAQRRAAQALENCYVIPATDVPLSDGIHNSAAGNVLIGERLARLAISQVYGKSSTFRAADLEKAVQTGPDEITLCFNVPNLFLNPLDDFGDKLDFIIEDAVGENPLMDCEFLPGSTKLKLERPVSGSCRISCGSQKDVRNTVPQDISTYMPILSFYREPVVLIKAAEEN